MSNLLFHHQKTLKLKTIDQRGSCENKSILFQIANKNYFLKTPISEDENQIFGIECKDFDK